MQSICASPEEMRRELTRDGRFCVLTSHHALQCGLAWQHSCLCSRHSLQWFKQTNKKGILGDVASRFFIQADQIQPGTPPSPKFQSSTLHEQRGLLHWSVSFCHSHGNSRYHVLRKTLIHSMKFWHRLDGGVTISYVIFKHELSTFLLCRKKKNQNVLTSCYSLVIAPRDFLFFWSYALAKSYLDHWCVAVVLMNLGHHS